MEWMLVKTLGSLAVVLALMAGLAVLVRRFVVRTGGTRDAGVTIDLLGSRSLGPRRSVQVLRVLNRIIVVGVSEHGMQTLSEMADEESLREAERRTNPPDHGVGESARQTRIFSDFPAVLRAALAGGTRRSRSRATETLV